MLGQSERLRWYGKPVMETGGIAKPPGPTAPTAPARLDVLHSARGVATELSPEAAVQQAGDTEAVRLDPSRVAGAALDAIVSEFIKRNVEIDPRTRELVFQVVDRETGDVVRQTPDEAILRLRAYIRELREKNAADEAGHRVEMIA